MEFDHAEKGDALYCKPFIFNISVMHHSTCLAHDVVVRHIQFVTILPTLPEISYSGSLQPWNLLWRWRSLQMRSCCHFTRWACSGPLIRFLDKQSPMCIPGAPPSYPRKMNISPAFSTHFERQLLFAQGVYHFVQICVCRLLQTTMILRCVTSLSQSFWPSRYPPFGTFDKHMHCTLIVRCNTFKPSLSANG